MKSFLSTVAILGVLFIILLAWQLGSMSTSHLIIPTIYGVVQALFRIVTLKTFPNIANDLGITIYEIVLGFTLATISGIMLSLVLSYNKIVRGAYLPLIVAIWSVPHIIFYPIIIVIFGLGSISKIAYAFLAAFPVITIGVMSSISKIDSTILASARSLGAKNHVLLIKVVFPAAISSIVSVLRVGFGLAIITTIVAEMLGSLHGIGTLLNTTSEALKTSEYYALLILVMLFAYALHLSASLVERRVKAWSHV